jgi:hypothetical protein
VVPLSIHAVERVFQRRRIAVVVLRRDDDEPVAAPNERRPLLRVIVRVLLEPRVLGLVEERQVDLFELEHLRFKARVLRRESGEPVRNGFPRAPRTGGAALSH